MNRIFTRLLQTWTLRTPTKLYLCQPTRVLLIVLLVAVVTLILKHSYSYTGMCTTAMFNIKEIKKPRMYDTEELGTSWLDGVLVTVANYKGNNISQFEEPVPDDIAKKFFRNKFKKHKEFNDAEFAEYPIAFGNVSDFDCDAINCMINGREIKRELIWETPKDMFTFIPSTEEGFLKEFRNPCWLSSQDTEENGKLYCLPYFYIIGFTKCGTTDLFTVLEQHPLISSRSSKETHYFDRMRRGRSYKMNRPPLKPQPSDNYLSSSLRQFAGEGHFANKLFKTYKKITGHPDILFQGITLDATPSHVWDNEFWELFHPGYREPPVTNADLIHTITPKAKIIVSLRDPIKRMQSAYQFFCHHNVLQCAKPVTNVAFHALVKSAIDTFNDCLSRNSVRGCVYNTSTHQLATHLYASIYSVYIKDWMLVFPKDQLYVLKFEEHISDEMRSTSNIFKFLQIPPLSEESLAAYLSNHKVRNSIPDSKKIGYILPETMKILEDFFRPYNRNLVELLGDEKWYWGYS